MQTENRVNCFLTVQRLTFTHSNGSYGNIPDIVDMVGFEEVWFLLQSVQAWAQLGVCKKIRVQTQESNTKIRTWIKPSLSFLKAVVARARV